jgi:hypothetical protein
LPGCPKLPNEAIFLGKTINEILFSTFIQEVMAKKPRTDVSTTVNLAKIINPQPILIMFPDTRVATPVDQNIFHIIDDPGYNPNIPFTIVIE